MSWIVLCLVSALFLGFYDLSKKQAVTANAVIPVLFVGTLFMAGAWLPQILICAVGKGELLPASLRVSALSPAQHGLLAAKSALVGLSWIASYFALKRLPLSVATPIRATGPLWTLMGALVLLGERPTAWQWGGIGVTLFFFALFSLAGRQEGIRFHRNAWVGLMVLATLLGAASSLYDKYLLGIHRFSPATVQAWFSVYTTFILAVPALLWRRGILRATQFRWCWSIPMIAATLLLADYAYFSALTHHDALVAVASTLRRGSVLISFCLGYAMFREVNFRPKALCLTGILTGILIILLSGRLERGSSADGRPHPMGNNPREQAAKVPAAHKTGQP